MTGRSYSTSFLFITLCFKESFFTEVGIKPLTAGVVILMSCLQCNCCCGSQHISVSICYFSFHLPTFIIDELQKMLEDVRFSKGDSREGKGRGNIHVLVGPTTQLWRCVASVQVCKTANIFHWSNVYNIVLLFTADGTALSLENVLNFFTGSEVVPPQGLFTLNELLYNYRVCLL